MRRCKRIVEYIKSSTPATYILIEYEKEFEVPLLKVLQENNTRWWSILLMMERMLVIFDQITLTLCRNNRRDFVIQGFSEIIFLPEYLSVKILKLISWKFSIVFVCR